MKSDDFKMIIGAVTGDAPYSLRKHRKLWSDYRAAMAVSTKAAESVTP